jgi:hypothetical protein
MCKVKIEIIWLLCLFGITQNCLSQETIDQKYWEVKNGVATFAMENGVIVGTTKLHTPNTFLCTKNSFSDFILDVDFWVDSTLNSGIQIRSNSVDVYRNGVVHGYQIEIDPSARGWTGGIYDEQRRGWLTPVLDNRSKDVFKQHEWNHFHIEAIGNSIMVWLNDVMTSRLIDDMTHSGFIGLQIHSIDNVTQSGKQIKWKNFHLMTEGLVNYLKPIDMKVSEVNMVGDYLSESEIHEGWLIIGKEGTSPEFIGNDLGFELYFECMVNSLEPARIEYGWQSVESEDRVVLQYVIRDDQDQDKVSSPGQSLASMQGRVEAKNILFPKRVKEVRPKGFWQQGKIICTPGKIEHWLNGFPVIDYTPEEKVNLSKENWQSFFRFPNSDSVRFRSIKYKPVQLDYDR